MINLEAFRLLRNFREAVLVPPHIECMPRDEACVATRTIAWWRRRPARWRRSPSLVQPGRNSKRPLLDAAFIAS